MIQNSKKLIIIAILIAGATISGTLWYVNNGKTTASGSILTLEEAGGKVMNYINQVLPEGSTATLISIVDDGSVYKVRLKIGESEYDSFIAKDGKYLFPEGYDLEKTVENSKESEQQQKKITCEDIKKTDKPLLEVFVVSKCPFGLQIQRILNEIVKNIPSLANNIEVEYIGSIQGDRITAMHGELEAQENLRQICIREEKPDKYWDYIDCHIKTGDVEGCLVTTGIGTNGLDVCMSNNSRGLEYAKKDFNSQEKYKATGSPTLFLNGEKVSEFDFGGRTAEAVKTLLCCGFKTESNVCSQKLTEASAATGFSETYSQSSGSSGGSCE